MGALLQARIREASVSRSALAAVLVISGCWAPESAAAGGLKAKRGPASTPLVACTIAPLALTPTFATPEARTETAADDEDDEEDEDEDEDETSSGFRLPGEGTCVAVTASLNSSVQYARQKAPAALKSQASDPTSFLWMATIGLRSSTVASDGTRVDAKLAILFQPPSDSTPAIISVVVVSSTSRSSSLSPSISAAAKCEIRSFCGFLRRSAMMLAA